MLTQTSIPQDRWASDPGQSVYVHFSSAWTAVNLGPSCSCYGPQLTESSAQTDLLQISRLKNNTEEERFRLEERQ